MNLLKTLTRNNTSRNTEFIYAFLPLIVITCVLLLHVAVFLTQEPIYRFDETIVTTISRQDFYQLLNTVQAEPHPPGFYLFLRLFPTNNTYATHQLLSLINIGLIVLALLYGYRSKVVTSYQLIPGLSIVFSTTGFFVLSSDIKQEILTFPLLLITFFVTLKGLASSKKQRLRYFITVLVLSLLILCFGYIFFSISLLCCIALLINIKLDNRYKSAIFTHLSLVGVYLYTFGYQQLLNNLTRFAWFDNNFNSVFRTLSLFLTGTIFAGFLSDFAVTIFLTLLGCVVYNYSGLPWKRRRLIGLVALTTLLLVGCYYFANLFVRPRYVFPLFFLLSLIAGWGVQLLKSYKLITIALVSALLLSNSFIFFVSMTKPDLNTVLSQKIGIHISSQDKVGLLDEHPVFPYVFRINNPQLPHVIPINIFMPTLQGSYDDITTEQILSEGKFLDMSLEDYSALLKETGLTSFVYKMQIENKPTYYDPKRKVFTVLVQKCQLVQFIDVEYSHMLYEFSNCKF